MSEKKKSNTSNFQSDRIVATNGDVKFYIINYISRYNGKSEYDFRSINLNLLAKEGSLGIFITYNKKIIEFYENGIITSMRL